MTQRIQVMPTDGMRAPDVASVLLTVPAHKDYIVIVRSAVAQLGACFGFTVGEIGDLRLAVDEACNLLVARSGRAASACADDIDDTEVGGLECRAGVRGDVLHVTVAAPAAAVEPPDTEGFGWAILTALVDALAWERDDDVVRVEVEKRRGIGAG